MDVYKRFFPGKQVVKNAEIIRPGRPLIALTTSIVVGMGITLGVVALEWAHSRQRTLKDFELNSRNWLFSIQCRYNVTVRYLGGIGAFINASKVVDKEEFESFAHNSEVADFKTKVAYLERMDPQGSGWKIKYFYDRGEAVQMPATIGASDTARQAAIKYAIDTGRATLSEKIGSLFDDQQSQVFEIFAPVFNPGATIETAEQRRRNLKGILLSETAYPSVIETNDVYAVSFNQHIYIYSSTLSDTTPIYIHPPAKTGPRVSLSLKEARQLPDAWYGEIAVGQKLLSVIFAPPKEFPWWYWLRESAVGIGVLGISLTCLLGLFTFRREQAIEAGRRGRVIHDAIIRSAHDAFIAIDEEGKVLEWSAKAEQIFGYKHEEALGQDAHSLIASEFHCKEYHQGMAHFLKTGEARVLNRINQFTARRRDGSEFPIEMMAAGTQIDGKWRFFAFVRDISERRKVEVQLQQAVKMEAIGQLTGGLAHDFNNLLGIIIGNIDLIKEEKPETSKALPEIDIIMGAAMRGIHLAKSLLAIARRRSLTPKEADINETIQSMMPIIRHTMGPMASIETDLTKTPLIIRIDLAGFESAVLNLVINARDAMTKEGKLFIRTYTREVVNGDPIAGGQLASGIYVVLEVTDTGVGLSPEVSARVFEPFFTTKERTGGTGLGLSTVYGFAQQSGGGIALYSEVGRGTTVRIYLPAVAGKALQDETATEDESHLGGVGHIVLVDDETDLLQIGKKWLEDLGYHVTPINSGVKALDLFKLGIKADLLITDLVMPEIDGVKLVEEVRTFMPNMKVLYISGFSERLLPGSPGLSCPILEKPYRKAELSRAVREILDRKEMRYDRGT